MASRSTGDGIRAGCVNAQSINNKTAIIQELIAPQRLDLLLVTETWHETSDSLSLRRLIPNGCSYIDASRKVLFVDEGENFVAVD